MNIELVGIEGIQNNNERVILRVLNDCDLGNYMIMDTTYNKTDGKISNKLRHSYIFPIRAVKKGEYIILYSLNGKDDIGVENNTKVHYFFWNVGYIWNNTGDQAFLYYVELIDSIKS